MVQIHYSLQLFAATTAHLPLDRGDALQPTAPTTSSTILCVDRGDVIEPSCYRPTDGYWFTAFLRQFFRNCRGSSKPSRVLGSLLMMTISLKTRTNRIHFNQKTMILREKHAIPCNNTLFTADSSIITTKTTKTKQYAAHFPDAWAAAQLRGSPYL